MSSQEDLSVREALHLVLARVDVLSSESVPLLDALGRILAAPVLDSVQLSVVPRRRRS